jgi:cytochrome c oxidase assembly protein subunit 15
MFHRYIAGGLGLVILVIAAIAWARRRTLQQSPWLATAVLALVIFQAALGMWTVTLLLKPVIVTLHLLGGLGIFLLLVWLALRQVPVSDSWATARGLRPWAMLGFAIVAVQVVLGGWVSSNYAALACIDFPTCRGEWLPPMDFRHGFQLWRELGITAAGANLSYDAMTAIHWSHRAGALVTLVYISALAWALIRRPGLTRAGTLLLLAVLAQVGLGLTNILGGLPLPVAVAHNAGAAVLLAFMVMINFALNSHASS